LRCCHNAVRCPTRRRGSSRARPATSRKRPANNALAAELIETWCSTESGDGTNSRASGGVSDSGKADHEPLIAPHRLGVDAELVAKTGDHGEAPRDQHAAAERRQHADAPVAQLVAASLDDDRAVVGYGASRRLLVREVLEQVLRGGQVEVVAALQAVQRRGGRHFTELARELPDAQAELERPAHGIAFPERHPARLARRGGHHHAIVRDRLDAPRGRPSMKVSPTCVSKTISSSSSPTRLAPGFAPARKTP
jgi:hypothetical protein